jgi:hypothetical protein
MMERIGAAAEPSGPPGRTSLTGTSPGQSLLAYQVDAAQRFALGLQVLVQRAVDALRHEADGLPVLLFADSEVVLDGASLHPPTNYRLLRVSEPGEAPADARRRPIIIVDPRAGHGPGIGGLRPDSEVGVALALGHPVYFVAFDARPPLTQTLADVLATLRRFVEKVRELHPDQQPALYGNCQAGWAVALLCADCSGLTGPAVLNGSPISYWAGEPGVNAARLAGGLLGGAWVVHLLADLGAGLFDGAWLIQNFEHLHPAEAAWDKYRRLFADPRGERSRFLAFERWWGSGFFFSKPEICAVVENLFIGNRLESAEVRICACCYVDLRRIRNPLLIFASRGDDITPPQQALHWIAQVYPNDEALVAAGQRIVYLLHEQAGHLGLFVSAQVARREHRAMITSLDALDSLEAGLYEMVLDAPAGEGDVPGVRFERRRVEDVAAPHPRASFEAVRAMSEASTECYERWVGPGVRALAGWPLREWLKWWHPVRAVRWTWAPPFNPWASLVEASGAWAQANPAPCDEDNPYLQLERVWMTAGSDAIEHWRRCRDAAQEALFHALFAYDAPPSLLVHTAGPAPVAGTSDQPSQGGAHVIHSRVHLA